MSSVFTKPILIMVLGLALIVLTVFNMTANEIVFKNHFAISLNQGSMIPVNRGY